MQIINVNAQKVIAVCKQTGRKTGLLFVLLDITHCFGLSFSLRKGIMFGIENRRYIGNKCKLMPWIRDLIVAECPRCVSLFDVFAGTGCVSACLLNLYDNIIINDFLFSNEVM